MECIRPDLKPRSAYSYGCRCGRCVKQNRRRNAEWAQKNPEQHKKMSRESSARFRARNLEELRSEYREWYRNNPEKIKAKTLQRRYGLTLAEREAMGNECVIGVCKSKVYPVVDHDHETGIVREILCRKCNIAIGSVDDSPARLRALAEYLEKHGKTN